MLTGRGYEQRTGEDALRELRQIIGLIEGQQPGTGLTHNLENLRAEAEKIERTVREFRERSKSQ